MAEDDEGRQHPTSTERTLRSVGSTLGGWARRVGELVSEVSGQPALAEPVRTAIEHASELRLAGDLDAAQRLLERAIEHHPTSPHLLASLRLTLVHGLLLGSAATGQAVESRATEFGISVVHLLEGATAVAAGRPDAALDAIRRALRDPTRLTASEERELVFLAHALASRAHLALGDEDRSLRELRKAKTRLPQTAGASLREWISIHGVDLLLIEDETREAESWLREELGREDDGPRPVVRILLARVLAARADGVAARAILAELMEETTLSSSERALLAQTRIRVGLRAGGVDRELLTLTDELTRQQPDDPSTSRLWALARVHGVSVLEPTQAGSSIDAQSVLDALARGCQHVTGNLLDRHLHELAHAALRLDHVTPEVLRLVTARLNADMATAPEELRLLATRSAIASRSATVDHEFDPGPPLRFRSSLAVAGPYGPDECSPLRDEGDRRALLAGARSLAVAEFAIASGRADNVTDALVQALIDAPGLHPALRLLSDLARPDTGTRLESVLETATRLLAAVPTRILGVPLGGVEQALANVIAARERLARPLTIAIMGEFSSGKSTFVNALLGEALAPMGVLPTTSTINVFRRGSGGGARVHYRDGSIETLAPDHVQPFLHGLDSESASRIRHVEIDHAGARTGDAAVVDTPGLNALDAFHEQVAREFFDEADAVVWVFSATRGGAASEAGMLTNLRAGGRSVLGILNKVDTLDADEQKELSTYLRQQLGEVLVDVIPLRGRDALAHRSGAQKFAEDPFAAVEDALEKHFLAHARELKRALTTRRLREAVLLARAAVDDAIVRLEVRAERAAAVRFATKDDDRGGLREFAASTKDGLLALDDLLTREAMAIGALRPGRGVVADIDEQDLAYLDVTIRDGAFSVLQRSLGAAGRSSNGARLVRVLEHGFVPWARGYLDGALEAGWVRRILAEQGRTAVHGEAAVRAAIRAALEPLARAWHDRVLELAPELERTRVHDAVTAGSTPRAEAVRLRARVRAGLDAVLEATEELSS